MPNYLRQNSEMVKGDELWLFISTDNGTTFKPTCFATQHSLNRSMNTTTVSSKDHGSSSYIVPGEGSWTASTEALMSITTTDSGAMAFTDMMDAFQTQSLVSVRFGKLSNYTGTGIVGIDGASEWTLGYPYWEGQAYITSLQASGGHGDSATFSIELSGVGQLQKKTQA